MFDGIGGVGGLLLGSPGENITKVGTIFPLSIKAFHQS